MLISILQSLICIYILTNRINFILVLFNPLYIFFVISTFQNLYF